MTNTSKTAQIIAVAALLAFGAQVAVAAWTSGPANPPAGNVDTPINATSKEQAVQGPLWVNTTGASNEVGLTIGQGLRVSATAGGNSRIFMNETADVAGNWSGIELRKNGDFQGGIFKLADSNAANNDIAIWNRTKPVVSVKQNDVTDFAGTIKITGGTPGAGKVLTSSDSFGTASWTTPASGSGGGTTGSYTLGAVVHYPNKRFVDGNRYATTADVPLCPSGKGPIYHDSRGYYYRDGFTWNGGMYEYTCNWRYADDRFDYTQAELADFTCPAGTVAAGLNFYNLGDSYSTQGSLYCRPFTGSAI